VEKAELLVHTNIDSSMHHLNLFHHDYIDEPNKNSYTTFRDYSTRQINEKIKISNIAHSTM